MKRFIFLKIFVFFLIFKIYANEISVIESTFKDSNFLFDKNLNTFAISGKLNIAEQYIVFNLKKVLYLTKIEIIWQEKVPKYYKVLGSSDYINWFTLTEISDKHKAIKKMDNYIHSIEIEPGVCQFVKIYIPQMKNFDFQLKIAEVQFFSASNIKPEVKNLKISEISSNYVVINWQTDYPTIGQIRLGLSPDNFEKIQTEYLYSRQHSIKIENLQKGKRYCFQIINLLPDGNYITSPLKDFKTTGLPLPEIEEIKVLEREYDYVILKIKNNIESKLELSYGEKSGEYESRVFNDEFKIEHIVKISNLIPLTKYYSKILITDRYGNKFYKFFDFITGEYNIALGKRVEGTFTNRYIGDIFNLEGDVIKRVNDGSFDYRNGMAVSFDPDKSDQFVIIDLEDVYPVERIITYWRALAYPKFYFIYASLDKKDWKKIATVNLENTPAKLIEGSGIPMKIGESKFDNLNTRFIKLIVFKNTPYYRKFEHYKFIQLLELKIYGVFNPKK